MIKRILLILGLIIPAGQLCAADGVNFSISIYQPSFGDQPKVKVFSDSAVVVNGTPISGFLTGFSLELEITNMDSANVEFNVHIVTLGSKGQTIAKRFKTEYDLPAIINDIEVKKGSFYSLMLVPKHPVVVPDRECPYNHNNGSDFTIFPSANFDLHFLHSSLAFYHTPLIKNLFESEYRLFRTKFHFNATSKQNLFLYPCEGHSVFWDKRFGTAFDPIRNNCYTLYATGLNTTDPFVIIHAAILRSYGYAPPFLSEGMANYFSLAIHLMKKISRVDRAVPLKELLSTPNYLNSDPTMADAVAATFVRYIIDQYSVENFMKLYDMADDRNLAASIKTIYSKSIETLESEWQNYIDTLNIPGPLYSEFADRAEIMRNYPLMLEYTKIYAEQANTRIDSAFRMEKLAVAYFFNGDYFNAAKVMVTVNHIDTAGQGHSLTLAGYRMMNGDYESAYDDLKKASAKDSTDEVLKFNLALNWLCRSDTAKAAQIWNELIHNSSAVQLQGESRTMLGLILRKSSDAKDKLEAKDLLAVAISIFSQQMQTDPSVPNPYLWTGIALVGLNDADNAYEQLTQALFLESRPFYVGMINLWMGKAADLRGKRNLAREHFSEVISVASAAYHRDEAQKYLDRAYSQEK